MQPYALRRAFCAAPHGLSPRITALLRRGNTDAPDNAAAPHAPPHAPDDDAAAAPQSAPAAARAALVARNSAALAELRSVLGGGGGSAASDAPHALRGREGDGASARDDDASSDAALLRDVRGVTAAARRGSQARVAWL